MARRFVSERNLAITVASAGTNAFFGAPASDGSMLVGLERQLDLSTHRARLLNAEIVGKAQLILVLGAHHVSQVMALGGVGKTFLLADYAAGRETGHSIADPFGGGLDVYRQMADELAAVLPHVIERLAEEPFVRGTS